MTKLTKVEELLKKGETYYANRVHIDIYGKGVIAGFHSRDDEVKKLRDALEFTCGGRCDKHFNPCMAQDTLAAYRKAIEE